MNPLTDPGPDQILHPLLFTDPPDKQEPPGEDDTLRFGLHPCVCVVLAGILDKVGFDNHTISGKSTFCKFLPCKSSQRDKHTRNMIPCPLFAVILNHSGYNSCLQDCTSVHSVRHTSPGRSTDTSLIN